MLFLNVLVSMIDKNQYKSLTFCNERRHHTSYIFPKNQEGRLLIYAIMLLLQKKLKKKKKHSNLQNQKGIKEIQWTHDNQGLC